jgi:hypothetical protein
MLTRRTTSLCVLTDARPGLKIVPWPPAIDIGKAELVCCVRVPAKGNPERRLQEVSTHSAMSRSLADWPTTFSGSPVSGNFKLTGDGKTD